MTKSILGTALVGMVTIAIVRSQHEPYRRANIPLSLQPQAFAVDAELTDEQVDPKWGSYGGTITGDQLVKLAADKVVLLETREIKIEASGDDAKGLKLDPDTEDTLRELIVTEVDGVITAPDFKHTKTAGKNLAKQVRDALKAVDSPSDKLSVGEPDDAGKFSVTAVFGDTTLEIDFTPAPKAAGGGGQNAGAA